MLAIIIATISAYVAYILGVGVTPGPKYTALSRWHERYYDVYLGGKFIFWIEEQHRKYGPVVRIAPDELHFIDADLWETFFTKAGRVDKYDWLSSRFGNDTSVLATAPDSIHRVRRSALNPLFSRQRILGLQDATRKKLNILIGRMENARAIQAPVEIRRGFGAFSEDVIMQYSFGHDYDSLNKEGWTPILHDSFMGVSIFGNTALHFPLLPKLMNALPESWIESLDPLYGLIFRMQRDFGQQIREAKASTASRGEAKDSQSTVFSELIEGDLPDAEKADRRLRDEAQLALSVGTFYLLSNPKVLARLCLELDEAIPTYDPANPTANLEWTQLEKLSYLTAVIKEAVRLSYSITSRNVRLLPKPFQFNEWTIPARTPVSMTIPFLNHDEEIFPNSRSFVPERWLGSPRTKNGPPLERYFCELYLAFASLLRFFDFELFETDNTDIEFVHDFFVAFPKLDSKGIRVFVRSRK
ncbi:cytochrome P450 [Aspergillus granulosus]|uniref:Cytochrome P450 n=1 Tax=Aspergillus granulosus TaxID=176169 RepID=A0ABR4H0E9_9EURO